MADEQVAKTGVESQGASTASPTTEAQKGQASPPADEKSVADSSSENRVPQTRFNEVIEQRNRERELNDQYLARIRDMESRLQTTVPQKNEVLEREVKRLVSKIGMSEDAAREVLESQNSLIQAEKQSARQAEVSAKQADNQRKVMEWNREKAKDPEYQLLEPELDRSFNSLSPEMKQLVVSSPDSLEMFYGNVKARNADKLTKEAFTKGVDQAYANKAAKQAVSSVPGSSANNKVGLSLADIKKMSNKEYVSRQSEINEAIKNGTLK